MSDKVKLMTNETNIKVELSATDNATPEILRTMLRANFGTSAHVDITLSDYRAATVWFGFDKSIKVVDYEAQDRHCQHDANGRTFRNRQGETGSAFFARVVRYIEAIR